MSPKILIVEDNPDWQKRIREYVEGMGYETALASSALEARAKIAADSQSFALILLDPRLTEAEDDREGLVLLDQMREQGIQTPCVLLTAHLTKTLAKDLINEYDVVAALEKVDFVKKPAIVRNALHKAMREAEPTASKVEQPVHRPKEAVSEEGTFQEKDIYKKRTKNILAPPEETYLDFELHVGHNGHVRARSDEGERTATISLDVPNDVSLALNLIEKGEVDGNLLRKLGKRLYEIIFPSKIDMHFNQTEAVARSKKLNIRIRLAIKPDVLARVPWEFVYREEGGYYLAANPQTVLSRYLDLPLPQDRVAPQEGPLHMLTIISNPSDQSPLDPDEWEEIVNSALATPRKDGAITTTTVKRATYEEIRNALYEGGKPHIVQFVGHGIYLNGKGYLALVDSNPGGTWIVDDERFANIFLGFDDHLRLVSLATCESAKSDSPQGFLGIAPQIVERGAPAVVAMQYRVLVTTAKIFLENFYTAVAARKPVDWAMQQARNAVSIKMGLDNREFATPVLYMRAKDGNIF